MKTLMSMECVEQVEDDSFDAKTHFSACLSLYSSFIHSSSSLLLSLCLYSTILISAPKKLWSTTTLNTWQKKYLKITCAKHTQTFSLKNKPSSQQLKTPWSKSCSSITLLHVSHQKGVVTLSSRQLNKLQTKNYCSLQASLLSKRCLMVKSNIQQIDLVTQAIQTETLLSKLFDSIKWEN